MSSPGGHAQIASSTMTQCTVTGLSIGDAVLNIVSLDGNFLQSVNIHVKVCTSKPAVPTGISFSKTSNIKLNESITATATPEVTTGGAVPVQYNWTIPSNFQVSGDATLRTITLIAKTAGTISSGIKVNAQNTCGTSSDYTNTTSIKLARNDSGRRYYGLCQ
ncbi:hypothetical protein FACS189413_16740 [Bacteroidia bacterium]|nr:hypothetical protein FACS189413_16740 [Bacteroidia bacterium]